MFLYVVSQKIQLTSGWGLGSPNDGLIPDPPNQNPDSSFQWCSIAHFGLRNPEIWAGALNQNKQFEHFGIESRNPWIKLFCTQKLTFALNWFCTVFLSMKRAESEKIFLVSSIINFWRYKSLIKAVQLQSLCCETMSAKLWRFSLNFAWKYQKGLHIPSRCFCSSRNKSSKTSESISESISSSY